MFHTQTSSAFSSDDEPTDGPVTIQSLLSTTPNKALLEGDAGIGKSLLSRKIALDWATDKLQPTFDVILRFEARDLYEETLEGSVLTHLLPEDSGCNETAMADMLHRPEIQKKTLIILDAFDEMRDPYQCPWVNKVLERKLMIHCSVLVTSRTPADSRIKDLSTHRYVLLGLAGSSRAKFLDNYSTAFKTDRQSYQMLEQDSFVLQSLTGNPLYLNLMCLIAEEGVLPKTRTELLTQVLEYFLRRAADKMSAADVTTDKMSVPDVTHLDSDALQELAFKSLSEGKVVMEESDVTLVLEQYTETGWLAKHCGLLLSRKGGKILRPKDTYVFAHKVFQEYLAARYLCERSQGVMMSLAEDLKQDVGVLSIVCGLLSVSAGRLTEFVQKFVCREGIRVGGPDPMTSVVSNGHGRFHLGLQCLSECGILPELTPLLPQLIPKYFVYNAADCSACLPYFLELQKSSDTPPCDLVLDGMEYQHTAYQETLYQQLEQIKVLDALLISKFSSMTLAVETLGAALRAVQVKHLFFYNDPVISLREVPQDLMSALEDACKTQNVISLSYSGSDCRLYDGGDVILTYQTDILGCLLGCMGSNTVAFAIGKATMNDDLSERIINWLNSKRTLKSLSFLDVVFEGDTWSRIFSHVAEKEQLDNIRVQECSRPDASDGRLGIQIRTNESENSTSVSVSEGSIEQASSIPGVKALPNSLYEAVSKFNIRRLSVVNQEVCLPSLSQSLTANSTASLQSLDLSFLQCDADDTRCLLSLLPMMTSLESLKLRRLSLEKCDGHTIAWALGALHQVQHLDLSMNDLGSLPSEQLDGVFAAMGSDGMSKLRSLFLEYCGLTDEHMGSIAYIPFKTLHVLHTQANELASDETSLAMLTSLLTEGQELREVTITIPTCTPDAMTYFIDSLNGNRNLKLLTIKMLANPENAPLYSHFQSFLAAARNFSLNFGMAQIGFMISPGTPTGHELWRTDCLALPRQEDYE